MNMCMSHIYSIYIYLYVYTHKTTLNPKWCEHLIITHTTYLCFDFGQLTALIAAAVIPRDLRGKGSWLRLPDLLRVSHGF